MRTRSRQSLAGVSRRNLFRTGSLLAAGLAGAETAQGANAKISGPEVYTRIGVRLRAFEIWRTERDIQADFREWESWYADISAVITRVPGVQAEVRGPQRGGPFPVLNVSWDPEKIGLTAGQIGRMLLGVNRES